MQQSESGLVNNLQPNWDVALDPVNKKDNFLPAYTGCFNLTGRKMDLMIFASNTNLRQI